MGYDIAYKATASRWDSFPWPAPSRFATREAWLLALAEGMTSWFVDLDCKLPAVRLGIGFPSSGRGSSVIGQCWAASMAADGVIEIWIAPQYGHGAEERVADILAHELTHAAVGLAAGHGPAFKRVAVALGLAGQMTATVAGPAFLARVRPILADLGPMPHGAHRLDGATTGGELPKPRCPKPGAPPQVSRMVKCQCEVCGYTVRTARTWLAKGSPICPTDNIAMNPEIDQ